MPNHLLTHNYYAFLKGIELSDLPKTFQDAVMVTRSMGVCFLWIDSLCIIQDSAMDWVNESSKMRQVYKNSYLNIAAAASHDATGGLFYPRFPLSITSCFVQYGRGPDMKYAGSTYKAERTSGAELVLFTRGWAFQELLLAPRTLIFGKKELHWKCYELEGSETYPEGPLDHEIENKNLPLLRKTWQDIHHKPASLCWKA